MPQPQQPLHRIVELDPKGTGAYRYFRDDFTEARQHSIDDPPSEDQDNFQLLLNCMPPITGTVRRRWGYEKVATLESGIGKLLEYQNDTTNTRKLLATAPSGVLSFNEDGTAVEALYTPVEEASVPQVVVSRDWAYFFDGVAQDAKKYNSDYGVQKLGIDPPLTAPHVDGSSSAGDVTLTIGRIYYLVFYNPVTGHYSDLSPASDTSGGCTAKQVALSGLAVSSDPQVTKKVLLASLDGADVSHLYMVDILDNAITTYSDNMPEDTLSARPVLLDIDEAGNEIGVTGNLPPSAGALALKHRGRIFMVDGQFLRFSKTMAECTTSSGTIAGRYEECWPAENEIDISEGTEEIRGLLSDGQTLFIGTERHIRRVDGDGPNFSIPEIVHNAAGIANQEVWKVTYLNGAPVGAMWLTPERRVLASDFNTYYDVGFPIQDVLNRINLNALDTAYAVAFSFGAYNLYILAVPLGVANTPNMLLVFNTKSRLWAWYEPPMTWFEWTLSDSPTAMLWNIKRSGTPQLLFTATDGTLYRFNENCLQDRVGNTPVTFPVTVRTSWLHLDQPTVRKYLNELEVMTGDPNLQVTVEGASNDADFDTPRVIGDYSSLRLRKSPFGTYKAFLAAKRTHERYFRLTFTSVQPLLTVLDMFNLEVIPGVKF